MNGKKIIWFSQHEPLQVQIRELKKIFGEKTEVVQHPKVFANAEEIVKIYKEMQGEEMVVVAPLSVIARLCDLGIKPLWAKMVQVPIQKAEVIAKGRGYKFVEFKRIKGLKIEFCNII